MSSRLMVVANAKAADLTETSQLRTLLKCTSARLPSYHWSLRVTEESPLVFGRMSKEVNSLLSLLNSDGSNTSTRPVKDQMEGPLLYVLFEHGDRTSSTCQLRTVVES